MITGDSWVDHDRVVQASFSAVSVIQDPAVLEQLRPAQSLRFLRPQTTLKEEVNTGGLNRYTRWNLERVVFVPIVELFHVFCRVRQLPKDHLIDSDAEGPDIDLDRVGLLKEYIPTHRLRCPLV